MAGLTKVLGFKDEGEALQSARDLRDSGSGYKVLVTGRTGLVHLVDEQNRPDFWSQDSSEDITLVIATQDDIVPVS